jgi:hypothetical protein
MVVEELDSRSRVSSQANFVYDDLPPPKGKRLFAAVRNIVANYPFRVLFLQTLFTNTSKYCYPWQYVLKKS